MSGLGGGLENSLGNINLGGGFGGIGGGLGGGIPFGGQMIPVVKGIPVQRIHGNQANRILRQHSNGRMVAVPPGRVRRIKGQRQGFQGRARPNRPRNGLQTSADNSRSDMLSSVVGGIGLNSLSVQPMAVALTSSKFASPLINPQMNTNPSPPTPVPSLKSKQTTEMPSKLGALQKTFQDSVSKLFNKPFRRTFENENDKPEDEFEDEEAEESEIYQNYQERKIDHSSGIHLWTDWSNKIIDLQL